MRTGSVPSTVVVEDNISDSKCCHRSVLPVEGQLYSVSHSSTSPNQRFGRDSGEGNSLGQSTESMNARYRIGVLVCRRRKTKSTSVILFDVGIKPSDGAGGELYVPVHSRLLNL